MSHCLQYASSTGAWTTDLRLLNYGWLSECPTSIIDLWYGLMTITFPVNYLIKIGHYYLTTRIIHTVQESDLQKHYSIAWPIDCTNTHRWMSHETAWNVSRLPYSIAAFERRKALVTEHRHSAYALSAEFTQKVWNIKWMQKWFTLHAAKIPPKEHLHLAH